MVWPICIVYSKCILCLWYSIFVLCFICDCNIGVSILLMFSSRLRNRQKVHVSLSFRFINSYHSLQFQSAYQTILFPRVIDFIQANPIFSTRHKCLRNYFNNVLLVQNITYSVYILNATETCKSLDFQVLHHFLYGDRDNPSRIRGTALL